MNAHPLIKTLALGALVVAAALLATPFWGNVWRSATDGEYVIPAESSLLRFEATELNAGSGDWWIYGQDGARLYHFTGQGSPPYRSITREAAAACPGFDPRAVATWCAPGAGP